MQLELEYVNTRPHSYSVNAREQLEAAFFDHFVAGTNHEEAGEIVKMLSNNGLSGMLNYGLEHAYDNALCDLNMKAFIQTIESTKSLPPIFCKCCCGEDHNICLVDLLAEMGIQGNEEEQDLELAHERLNHIIQKCQETNVPLVIDPGRPGFNQPLINSHTPRQSGTLKMILQ